MDKYSKYVHANELKRERKNKVFSIADIVKMMGDKSNVTYYNIERGISKQKISHVNRISPILKNQQKNFFNIEVQ